MSGAVCRGKGGGIDTLYPVWLVTYKPLLFAAIASHLWCKCVALWRVLFKCPHVCRFIHLLAGIYLPQCPLCSLQCCTSFHTFSTHLCLESNSFRYRNGPILIIVPKNPFSLQLGCLEVLHKNLVSECTLMIVFPSAPHGFRMQARDKWPSLR